MSLNALGTDPVDAVSLALRVRGAATRADIARITGISRTHTSRVVGDMARSGMVVEVSNAGGDQHARTGRPGTLVALAPTMGHCIGVDIAHRRVRVVVADLAHRILAEERADLAADEPVDAVLERLDGIISAVLPAGSDHGPLLGVGVALPGPVEATTHAATQSSIAPSWVGAPVADVLTQRFGRPVHVDNNGNLAAFAEWVWGAGQGVENFIYVKLDTGIGGGIISGGRLIRGADGLGGEVGHVTVDPDGVICRCGNRGCLETLAGSDAFLDLLRPSCGADLDLPTALSLARDGAPAVLRALDDVGTVIGIALASLVNVVNPQAILVGGPLSGADRPLLDAIEAEIGRRALPASARRLHVTGSRLGERAEILGAVASIVTDSRLPIGRAVSVA